MTKTEAGSELGEFDKSRLSAPKFAELTGIKYQAGCASVAYLETRNVWMLQ